MKKLINLLLQNLDWNFIAALNAAGTKNSPYMAINYLRIPNEMHIDL